MAYQDFQASWVDVYNANGGWHKNHSNHPMQYGGSSRSHTFIRIPDAVKDAINSSRTSAGLSMRMYVRDTNSEIDIGNHNHSSNRSTGATGLPQYSYNETWRPSGGTGWREYGMSNWFMPRFLSGSVKGLVLYNTGGEYGKADGRGVSTYVRFRVTGEWEPDAKPTVPEISGSNEWTVGTSDRVYLNPNKDGLSHSVKYEIGGKTIYLATNFTGSYVDWTMPNNVAEEITNSTRRTGRIVIVTYEGSTNVGARNIDIVAVVPNNSTFRPTISNESISIAGSDKDSDWGVYIQGHSKISVKHSNSAKYGASISRATITIEGHTYSGTNVTADPFEEAGDRHIRIEVVDSRGFSHKVTHTRTSTAYSRPSIKEFTVRRTNEDNISFYRRGTFSDLGGKNSLTITHYSKTLAETSMNEIYTVSTNSGAFDNTLNYGGYAETTSYEFELIIKDDLGNVATSTDSIGTAIVPMSWSKVGIGVGKVWERGALDVSGTSYFDGNTDFTGVTDFNGTTRMSGDLHVGGELNVDAVRAFSNPTGEAQPMTDYPIGISMFESHGKGFPTDYGVGVNFYHSQYRSMQLHFSHDTEMYVRGYRADNGWSDWAGASMTSGSNSNGNWVRFADGTQILRKHFVLDRADGDTWATLPAYFVDTNYTVSVGAGSDGYQTLRDSAIVAVAVSGENNVRVGRTTQLSWEFSGNLNLQITAIGRWK